MKHTQGPWFVVDGAFTHIYRRPKTELYEYGGGVAGDKPIATVFEGWSEGGYDVKANAHLIAAAPDLLDEHQEWAEKFGSALMAVMQEDFGPITELAMRMPFDFHEQGDPTLRSAAIAKAKGESK